MDTGCGDIQQDCDSFCGPSFKLQRSLPVFKARKHCNTRLESDDEASSGEVAGASSGGSSEPDGRAATSASVAAFRRVRRSPVMKAARAGRPPPLMPPTTPPPAAAAVRREARLRVTDSTNSDLSGRSFPTDDATSPTIGVGPQRRLAKPPTTRRVRLQCEAAQQVGDSVRAARQNRLASLARRATDKASRERLSAAAAPTQEGQRAARRQAGRPLKPPSNRPADSKASSDRSQDDGSPIDYMAVYHRLRMGRFGFLYDFPAFGVGARVCGRQLGRPSPSGRNSGTRAMAAAVAAAAAAVNVDASPAVSSDATVELIRDARTEPPSNRATTAPLPSVSDDRGTDMTHLLRLLRDDSRQNGRAAANEGLSGAEPPPLPPPPPVPKPRKSTSRTASSKSETAAAALNSSLSASAASARSVESNATPQTLSASLAACGPFASAIVCGAEPFESPRRCYLVPSLVTHGAVELAPIAWRRLRYRCADLRLQQRLSVTGHLLGRRDGAAPCRWLSSSALLTQLRHPSRVELPAQHRAVSEAAAAIVQTHRGGRLGLASLVDQPSARFAFHAMNSRRSRSGQGRGDKVRRNLYAVSVS